MRKNKKNEKKKKGIIIAIFVVAIFMAIGYAALQAELTINAVGKIYSDWDVHFTDSSCEFNAAATTYNVSAGAEALECFAGPTFATGSDHLSLYDEGITEHGDDNPGGIYLDIYTEFAAPDHETTFDIEITNFSSMWDAVLISIEQLNTRADDDLDDWIIYEFSDDLVAYEGDINKYDEFTVPKLVGATTVLDAATPSAILAEDNLVQFTIKAKWNPGVDYKSSVPDSAIKKSTELANKGDTDVETYTQKDTFKILWEAWAPGTNPWTP